MGCWNHGRHEKSSFGGIEIDGELDHEGHESYSLDVVGRRMVSGDGVLGMVLGSGGIRGWRGDGH